MYIVEKILSEIEFSLCVKYGVNIQMNDWTLFKQPLTNNEGDIDRENFLRLQEKSIEIIRKILDYHGKKEIVKFLAVLASIEPGIQELQPWQRDHVVHALNSFILGIYINEKFSAAKPHAENP